MPALAEYTRTVGPWPADLRHLATPPILAASDAYAEARDRLEAARVELEDARAAVKAAVVADNEAAVSAADAGTDPPKPKAGKAREIVEGAERNVSALEGLQVRRTDRYLACVVGDFDVLRGKVDDELRRAAPLVNGLLDSLAEKLVAVRDVELLRNELGDDVGWLTGRSGQFIPAREGRVLERDPLAPDVRQTLDALRSKVDAPDFARASF